MIRIIKILITGFIASLFLFPVPIHFLSGANTKMIMAAFGVCFFVFEKLQKKTFSVSNDFFVISLIAIAFSLWTYVAIIYNHTSDDVFTDYFISLWVWLGGAYLVYSIIRRLHGEVTVELMGNYLIGVCIFQCLMAIGSLYIPFIKWLCDISLDKGALNMFSEKSSRLYGFGSAFDPSGLRMAAVLIIDSFLFCQAAQKSEKTKIVIYILSYVIILSIGNMIARSTPIGAILGIGLIIIFLWKNRSLNINLSPVMLTVISLSAGAGVFVYLYLTNPSLQSYFRFGFEGFFSLAEKGEWQVNSNDMLKEMVVWPETLKTWIIGDGYCKNPRNDPNFLGEIIGGFYKGTDIGYLRFIFYSGIPGLLLITSVFILSTRACIRNLGKQYAILFIFLLISNLVGWIKVMSDIIMVYAPFLIMAFLETENNKDPLLNNAGS